MGACLLTLLLLLLEVEEVLIVLNRQCQQQQQQWLDQHWSRSGLKPSTAQRLKEGLTANLLAACLLNLLLLLGPAAGLTIHSQQ
jgi:hypothetical protein